MGFYRFILAIGVVFFHVGGGNWVIGRVAVYCFYLVERPIDMLRRRSRAVPARKRSPEPTQRPRRRLPLLEFLLGLDQDQEAPRLLLESEQLSAGQVEMESVHGDQALVLALLEEREAAQLRQ